MAGEVRIGGSQASVNLQGSDTITTDQTYTFPDTGGEIVVTPGTADIETSGGIIAGGFGDFSSVVNVTRVNGSDAAFQAYLQGDYI